MAGDLAQQMGRNIVERTKLIGIALLVLPTTIFWYPELVADRSAVSKTIGDQKDSIGIVFAAFLWLGLVVILLARNLSLSQKIDFLTFRLRSETEKKIKTIFVARLSKIDQTISTRVSCPDFKIMPVFYKFANQQDILRGTAFHYWEAYYALLDIAFYSLISFMLSIFASTLTDSASGWLSALPFGLFLCVMADIVFGISKRILEHAEEQANVMFIDQQADVISHIRGRLT